MNVSRGVRLRPALARETWLSSLLIVVAVAVTVVAGSQYWSHILLLGCVYLIAANGLNLLRSQAGQMSFGQGAIVGVAAYVTALAAAVWELPAPLPVVAGLVAGLITGLLMSLPSLRVQGFYLGFVTMAAALALPEFLYLFEEQTRAMTGVNVLPSWVHTTLFGSVDILMILVVVCAAASLLLVAAVQSSRFGRQMRMAGESPEAASTLGLSPGGLRLAAFGLSSACASVAGVLYVGLIQYVAPGSFALALSIMLYFIVVIGGPGTIAGPIAGVVIMYFVPDVLLASYLDYRMLIYGMLAMVVMFAIPDGVVGGLRRLVRRVKRETGDVGIISLTPILQNAPAADERAETSDDIVLSVQDVTRSFGSVRALDGASLEIRRGTLHAVVGPNGSGKTTLLNAISGLIAADSGSIRFDDQDVTRLSATGRARLGLARTFQTPRVLGGLSVWENIDCGASAERPIPWVAEALESVRAEWDAIGASRLPHGQRRFLEVLRVLHRGPQLVALDEPAAGLSHLERAEFGRLLRELVSATGITILMVEHDLELVWSSADMISAVDGGRVIATGTPAELRHSDTIAHLFSGVSHVGG